jgi:hypothetical protein
VVQCTPRGARGTGAPSRIITARGRNVR